MDRSRAAHAGSTSDTADSRLNELAALSADLLAPCAPEDPTGVVIVVDPQAVHVIRGKPDAGQIDRVPNLSAAGRVARESVRPPPSTDRARRRRSASGPCQLFSWVAALGADACGAMRLHQDSRLVGTVYVEKGRVCWASTPTLRRRLTALLKQRTGGFDEDVVEDIIRWCGRTGEPFGEALVKSGTLSAAGLCSALRQQTAEAFADICSRGSLRVAWVPNRRSYDATFTFTATDILTEQGRLAAPEVAKQAQEHIQRLLKSGGAGVACAHGRSQLPIASIRTEDWSARKLELVASWAKRLVSATSKGIVGATSCHGRALVAWRYGDVVYATTTAPSLLPLRLASVGGTLKLLGPDDGYRQSVSESATD